MTAPLVLVLGANGRFGRAATDAFAAAGWQVLAQMRRAPARPLPAGAEALMLPLDDVDGLARAAAGAAAVVHAINPVYTRWDAEVLPMARQSMDLAQRLGAHFILPGNIYAYGEGMPARLDESTPERPTTPKGRLRQALEAELDARSRDPAHPLRASVLRAGDFYGAGTGSWIDLMIVRGIAKGHLTYPGPMDVPHAWAYLPDLARAVVAVAAHPPASPGLRRLHFAGQTLTGGELLDLIEAAAGDLGLHPAGGWRRRTMPWWPLKLVSPLWPMGRELLRMSYLWRVPHAVGGDALAALVGPLPATPPRAAMREALRELGIGADGAQPTAAAAAR